VAFHDLISCHHQLLRLSHVYLTGLAPRHRPCSISPRVCSSKAGVRWMMRSLCRQARWMEVSSALFSLQLCHPAPAALKTRLKTVIVLVWIFVFQGVTAAPWPSPLLSPPTFSFRPPLHFTSSPLFRRWGLQPALAVVVQRQAYQNAQQCRANR